jgi:hypothetical protein
MICGALPELAHRRHMVRQNDEPSTVSTTTRKPSMSTPQLSQRAPYGKNLQKRQNKKIRKNR